MRANSVAVLCLQRRQRMFLSISFLTLGPVVDGVCRSGATTLTMSVCVYVFLCFIGPHIFAVLPWKSLRRPRRNWMWKVIQESNYMKMFPFFPLIDILRLGLVTASCCAILCVSHWRSDANSQRWHFQVHHGLINHNDDKRGAFNLTPLSTWVEVYGLTSCDARIEPISICAGSQWYWLQKQSTVKVVNNVTTKHDDSWYHDRQIHRLTQRNLLELSFYCRAKRVIGMRRCLPLHRTASITWWHTKTRFSVDSGAFRFCLRATADQLFLIKCVKDFSFASSAHAESFFK